MRVAASAFAAPAAAMASQGPVDCAVTPSGRRRCLLSHLHPAECRPKRLAALAAGTAAMNAVFAWT